MEVVRCYVCGSGEDSYSSHTRNYYPSKIEVNCRNCYNVWQERPYAQRSWWARIFNIYQRDKQLPTAKVLSE